MSENIQKGKEGERIAAQYLESKGYEILKTNFKYRNKEIDIIALLNGLLVVVEVKMRAYKGDEWPGDVVTLKKQHFIIEATEAYMLSRNMDVEVRFDVIFIYKRGEDYTIEHIDDAFSPMS